jgi:hypothetical protein
MQKITSSKELRAAIVAMELVHQQDRTALKEEFYTAYQQIQPINILKNTVKKAMKSSDLKEDMVYSSLGMAAGFVSKKLFEGETHSTARKLLGTALMLGVTNIVAKNPEFVKGLGLSILKLFRRSSSEEEMEGQEDETPYEYEE